LDEIAMPPTLPTPAATRRVTADYEAILAAADQAGGMGLGSSSVMELIPGTDEYFDNVHALLDHTRQFGPSGVLPVVPTESAGFQPNDTLPAVEFRLDRAQAFPRQVSSHRSGEIWIVVVGVQRIDLCPLKQEVGRVVAGV
jgi:hypothetical protein